MTGHQGTDQSVHPQRWQVLVISGLAALFMCEVFTPLGFAHGTLYTPLVLLAALARSRRFVLASGLSAITLTLVGIPLSPAPISPQDTAWIYMGNRLFSILSVTLTTGVCLFALRALHSGQHARRQLHRSLDDLQQQQFLLNVAGQVAHIGGWIVRLPGDDSDPTLTWSDEVYRIHGLPVGQPISMEEAISFYKPESRRALEKALQDCRGHGHGYDLELEISNRQGEELWTRAIARAVRRNGRTVEIQGTFQDITHEKHRDLSLQESRLRFQQLADAIPISVWTADNKGNPELINRALSDYVGNTLTAQTPVSQWLQSVHPEERRQALRLWVKAIRTGQSFEKELRLRHHDGSYHWHLARAMPARDTAGEVAHWFGLAIDIDERRTMDEKIRKSDERFRFLSRATTDAVWDWDPNRRELWWNEGMSRLFGYEPHEIGTSSDFWLEHIHPDERERIQQSILSVINGKGDEWHEQYRFLRKDGTAAHVADHGLVIRDDDSHVVRMVGGMSDITAQRTLQEQLQQSERLRAVGELTGGVAHDFNNLLTVIIGNAELLDEELRDRPQLQPLIDITRQAADRGTDLTRRMLAFARRQPLNPRPLDLRHLLEQTEPLLRHALRADIELEMIHAAGVWDAHADPSQLENSLINLCLNARDAMPDGGKLTIETANMWMDEEYCARHEDIRPGQYAMIAVSDTGAGIDAAILGRVFDPFFTTKGKGRGTGLGLSMVYGFIKQSGGHIKIYSERQQGTTVRMYLPRSTAAASPEKPAVQATPGGGQETILVVEDDAQVRHTVRHQLEALGYTVLESEDASEALERFEQHREAIDALFTDVVLPGDMNGKQLADRIRAMCPELPILFTSGYTKNAIVHHGRLDAGVMLLSKPYRRNDLARRLREVLDGCKAG
ncbi:MAG: PAS domain-containing protein [Pseudohongiellaceae bacterium]